MSRFSLNEASAPAAALGISAGHVSGAMLDIRGGRTAVSSYASEPLAPAALVPSLTALNVVNRPEVAAAVGSVLSRIGRPRRVGLVVADPVAKVSLVKLQQVPVRAHDLAQVIRWQVRKSAPFSIDEAQVGFDFGLRGDDGQEFVVTVARRDIIAEYEAVCAEAGAHAGIVDVSTLNAANAVMASGTIPPGDWLLVNVSAGWESIAIMRGQHLIFFRSRGADGEGTLAELVHQTAMYYEDRLSGAGFSRVLLCGGAAAGDVEPLRRTLSNRLATPVEAVDPTRAASLTDRVTAAPGVLDMLTPLVGMALRSREVAA
jgi:Tfp pilus assembly PilM family ATPase